MAKEYLFLLAGLVLGLLIGWLAGRRLPQALTDMKIEVPPALAEAQSVEAAGIKLVVNGNTVEVPSVAMAEIQGFIQAGQKMEAVKVLREATGLNMAAAKSVVESLRNVMG